MARVPTEVGFRLWKSLWPTVDGVPVKGQDRTCFSPSAQGLAGPREPKLALRPRVPELWKAVTVSCYS